MNQQRKKSNLPAVLLVSLLLVGLYGCPKPQNGTTPPDCDVRDELSRINESYNREFADRIIGETAEPFVETLSLIDFFNNKCGNEARDGEKAHVKVLQSLIHIQREEFDLAKRETALAEEFVSEAEPRDNILIKSLPGIINGLEAYNKIAPPNVPTQEERKNAVDTLDIVLPQLDAEDYSANDEGIYLPLTYYRSYLHRARALAIGEYGHSRYERDYQKEPGEAKQQRINDYNTAISTLGDALGRHMPAEEFNQLEAAADPDSEIVSVGKPGYAPYKELYIILKAERDILLSF